MISYRGSRFECATKTPLKPPKKYVQDRCTRGTAEKTHGLLATTWHYLAPAHMYVVPATKYPKVEGSQVRTLITPYYIQNTSIRYPKKVTVSQPCTHRVVLIMLVYVEYNMYYLLYYYIKCPVLLGFLFPSQHCSTLFTRSHLQKYPLKSTLCVRKYTNLSFQRSCLHWLVTTYSRPFFLASFPG